MKVVVRRKPLRFEPVSRNGIAARNAHIVVATITKAICNIRRVASAPATSVRSKVTNTRQGVRPYKLTRFKERASSGNERRRRYPTATTTMTGSRTSLKAERRSSIAHPWLKATHEAPIILDGHTQEGRESS